jgi:geranylgeranyl reductase family protein
MTGVDAIIVGAGPAGCAAAYDLLAAGKKVLLLDRKRFPRVKPCAGALTIKAVNRLRYSIAPVIRFVARDLNVSLFGYRKRHFHCDTPICVMTVREEFDRYCLDQTLALGGEFVVVLGLSSFHEDGSGVSVTTTDGAVFQADYLIGADGANSQVRRLSGEFASGCQALALEGQVPTEACSSIPNMQFDFGWVPGGYGWMFPKAGHINVGLYTQRSGVAVAKAALVEYSRKMLGTERVDHMIGFPIGIGGQRYRAGRGRVLLVGDAAGMTDPLLGEGIHNAIKSGQLAAQAIIEAGLGHGSAQGRFSVLLEQVQRDLSACSIAARCFYDLLLIGFGALVSPPARLALMRGFAAGLTFREILGSFCMAPWYRIGAIASVIEYEKATHNTK